MKQIKYNPESSIGTEAKAFLWIHQTSSWRCVRACLITFLLHTSSRFC